MKYLYALFIVLVHLTVNAQIKNTISIDDFESQYSKLNNSKKKEVIIDLGNKYSKTSDVDFILRSRIVDFMLDSVIFRDKNNSSLAAKILLQYSRINEYDSANIQKLLQILNYGCCNIDLLQLAGCIGDERFINPIYDIYTSEKKKSNFEIEVLKNTLARLGHKELIQNRIVYFQSILNEKKNPITQEYTDNLRAINYINRKEFYDLLFSFILNDRKKVLIVGSYGGDPFGGDDNIYCTLSSFSLELIANGIIDFPLNQIVCTNDKKNPDVEIAKKWFKTNNKVYQFKKWHPYYGFNYMHW